MHFSVDRKPVADEAALAKALADAAQADTVLLCDHDGHRVRHVGLEHNAYWSGFLGIGWLRVEDQIAQHECETLSPG